MTRSHAGMGPTGIGEHFIISGITLFSEAEPWVLAPVQRRSKGRSNSPEWEPRELATSSLPIDTAR
ncbi:MAG: hypothetical protein D6723_16930 [Acidobacteria bacterium]|nr:MAG: hypothetical protein D6723_16930 [Acidobacteriota bacterium]